MYLVKTPSILKPLANDLNWEVKTDQKEVFLTFDDGPIPEVTEWVLDTLDAFGAKATFFCIGKNVAENPEIYRRILKKGHSVGNHTFSHAEGWKSSQISYLREFLRCEALVDSSLFRPPYGRIKREQARAISHRSDIVMWDVLSADFDPKNSGEDCLNNCLRHCKKGSIVVFHDSKKAAERMMYALPRFLEVFTEKGYSFPALKPSHFRD